MEKNETINNKEDEQAKKERIEAYRKITGRAMRAVYNLPYYQNKDEIIKMKRGSIQKKYETEKYLAELSILNLQFVKKEDGKIEMPDIRKGSNEWIIQPISNLDICSKFNYKKKKKQKKEVNEENKTSKTFREIITASTMRYQEEFIYNTSSGFAACFFENTEKKEVIIAYRGSDDIKDWVLDFGILFTIKKKKFKQLDDAKEFYDEVRKYLNTNKKSDYKIILTGHSLGGCLALRVAEDSRGCDAYAFNPVSTGSVSNVKNKTDKNSDTSKDGTKKLLDRIKKKLVEQVIENKDECGEIITFYISNEIAHFAYHGLTKFLRNDDPGAIYVINNHGINFIAAHVNTKLLLEGVAKEEKTKFKQKILDKIIKKYKSRIKINSSVMSVPYDKSTLPVMLRRIEQSYDSLNFNMLAQLSSKYKQIIPTFNFNYGFNNDFNYTNEITDNFKIAYDNFYDRSYEEEYIQMANKAIEEGRMRELMKMKDIIKKEIVKEEITPLLKHFYKTAMKTVYQSQGMSDDMFNRIMTYITDEIKQAMKNRSFADKYFYPADI